MKRVLAFALAVAVGVASAQPVLSQQTPEPTKIGFLNVRRVFQEYWKRQSIEDSLKARSTALDARAKEGKARLQSMAEALATLNKDSDEYRAKVREIELARFEMELGQKEEANRIERDARRQEALLYKDIVRECQAFGESRGYASIQMFAPIDENFERIQDLDVVIATRATLWRDDRLDVTQQVLDFLNAGKPR